MLEIYAKGWISFMHSAANAIFINQTITSACKISKIISRNMLWLSESNQKNKMAWNSHSVSELPCKNFLIWNVIKYDSNFQNCIVIVIYHLLWDFILDNFPHGNA